MGRDKDTNEDPNPSIKYPDYSYKANANLVLQSENRGRQNEPTGEAESLRGRDLGRMGSRAARSRPQVAPASQLTRNPTTSTNVIKRPRVTLSNITTDSFYQPKTEETQVAYEAILNVLLPYLGDVDQEVLRNAADEVLSILKDERLTDPQRIKEVREILTGIQEDTFAKIVQLGKRITDYKFKSDDEDTKMESHLDDEQGVSILFNNEETGAELFDDDVTGGDEGGKYVVDSESEDDEEEGGDANETQIRKRRRKEDAAKNEDDVDIQSIDAYWLQRELSPHYGSAQQSQEVSTQVFQILSNLEEGDAECENELVSLLEYDKFKLVRKLMHNRYKIVLMTRLSRAGADENRRMEIETELRRDDRFYAALNELHKKQRVGEDDDTMDQDEDDASSSAIDTTEKHLLDLDDMIFEQGSHFMANRDTELPKGSVRNSFKGYEEVIIPAPKPIESSDEKRISISSMPGWTHAAFPKMKELNRVQSRVYQSALYSPENLLICAPTGSGKTNIAVLCILHELGLHWNQETKELNDRDFKIVYVAPMKALVQEVVGNLNERFSPYGLNIQELTGDRNMTKQQISETQIIVTTPEKWDIVTRKSGDRTFVQQVKLIIIDEIHLLHDDRGPVLESIVARTIRQMEVTQEVIRIVGLSATLPNYQDVATFLRVNPQSGLHYFDATYRPVPLEQQYLGVNEKKALKRMNLMNQLTYEKVMEIAGQDQVLVFVHSRKETVKTARALRDMAVEQDTIGKILREDSASRQILIDEAEGCKSAELKDILPFGFGVHHAGMTRVDRTLVEDLFFDKHIQVLVSTATLAWGVNLPAHRVIIKGTQIYSPELGRWTELSALDVMQMMGRAGRLPFDSKGEGIIITNQNELQYYLSLLNQQLPIESQFLKRLADQLNAEVVLGTIQNVRDAVEWLGYTYLYVRMMHNPSLYGVTTDRKSDPTLYQFRTDLIHTAATLLDKHNLIKYDKSGGTFQVTDLGRVASHYYITYQSIATFNENLKPTMSDIELFRLFSLAQEFKNMTVRQEEKLELLKMVERVPIPIKESIDEPSAKVNVLLQTYISNLKLEGFALVADMTYITQSAGRLTRALFEIAVKRGWAQLADKILTLAKMIEKRMWGSQTPLRQFKQNIPEDILKQFEKRGIQWNRLYDLSPAELGSMIRFPKMGNTIYKCLRQFPRLELSANILPITRSLLQVELTLVPVFQYVEKIHGPAETFWVIVEDVDGEQILHHELFILKSKYAATSEQQVAPEHFITFTVPIFDPLPPQYFIRVVSDKWLGSETRLPVSFRHLILPDQFPAPTELLDLQPLSISAVRNPKLESIFFPDIKAFNPVQTQVFNSVYHSDENFLLSAPSSSGKSVITRLAVLRDWTRLTDPNASKTVICTPLQSVADRRYKEWSTLINQYNEAMSQELVVTQLTGNDLLGDLRRVDQANVVIATAEQWDIVSRKWRVRKQISRVTLFVVDEMHLIGGQHGPTMEVVVSRMRYIASQLQDQEGQIPVRIFAVGASVSNAQDLGEWIGANSKTHTLFHFHPSVRPTPMEIHIQGFVQQSFSSRALSMSKPTYLAIKNARADERKMRNEHETVTVADRQVIVFVPSRRQARFAALELVTFVSGEEDNEILKGAQYRRTENSTIEGLLNELGDRSLANAAPYGIGILHDALSEREQAIVRHLYNIKYLQVLIVVYDYSWRLHEECHTVIVQGTQFYNGKEYRYQDYSIMDLLDLMRHAQRESPASNCKCYLLCNQPRKEYYKKFLFEPFPIESHFDHFLLDTVNAEIANKTITGTQDAVDYITWSFLYRRLRQNPNYYNLHGTSHQHLSDYLSELVDSTLTDLQQSQCILMEPNDDNTDTNLSAMNLGTIASHFYVQCSTIEIFSTSITEKTKLRGLMEILCAATEFDSQVIRQKEEGVLRKMAAHAPLKLERTKFNDPHTKVNLLIQSHFSRNRLSPDLEKDKEEVLLESVRLLPAMVDVVATERWLNPALAAMELSQMIVQAMWDKDSVLLQLPHFTRDLCERCEKQGGVETIFDLINMDDDKRSELLKDLSDDEMTDVAKALNRYPNIEVSFEIEDSDQITAGSGVVVWVILDIEQDEEEENNGLVGIYAPHFPQKNPKIEEWWILIGDVANNQIKTTKRMAVTKPGKVKLQFIAPSTPGEHEFKLYFMCDSYVGCDQDLDIKINVLPGDGSDEESDAEMQ